jgi:hypothetical protein
MSGTTGPVEPFPITPGETFDPYTSVGIVQNGGATEAGGNTSVTVTSLATANASEIASIAGNQPLDTTSIVTNDAGTPVTYTTQGSQDYNGSNEDGLGGITLQTEAYQTTFTTNNQVLAGFGISSLQGTTYYIGKTASGLALVESVIVFPANAAFTIGHGGTLIVDAVLSPSAFTNTGTVNYDFTSIACYLRGTSIATPGGETLVENLSIGDAIVTASGETRAIRWIGTRSYSRMFAERNADVMPVMFRAGSIADNVPSRDLFVSPNHAMFVDGVLVPADMLINGTSIVRAEAPEQIDYFHVELESHDILLANGAPAESFVNCDSRGMFHNVAEHAALYPVDDSPSWTFCAPRLEDGPRLDAIRARLAARASASAAVPAGVVHGHLDHVTHEMISGWAWVPTDASAVVEVEILVDGGVIGRTVANKRRADVKAAGFGHGRYGFELELPVKLSPYESHDVSVRIVGSDATLGGSPQTLAPTYQMTDASVSGFANAIARMAAHAGPATVDETIRLLVDQADLLRDERIARTTATPSRAIANGPLAIVIADAGDALDDRLGGLVRLGFRVSLVSADLDAGIKAPIAGVTVEAAPRFRSVEEVLRMHGASVSLVVVAGTANMVRFGELVRTHCQHARLVLDITAENDAVDAGGMFAMRSAKAVLTRSEDMARTLRAALPSMTVRVASDDAALASVVGSSVAPRIASVRRAG